MHKRTFCLQRCVFDVLPTLLDEVKKLWPTPRPTRGNEWMEAVERVGQNTTYQSHGKHERGSETARRSVWIHFVISRSGVRVRLPAPSFRFSAQVNMGEFPSGQRGQTVNLLSVTSVVRIHLPPPYCLPQVVRCLRQFYLWSLSVFAFDNICSLLSSVGHEDIALEDGE